MPTVHTRRTRLSLYLSTDGLVATLPSGQTVRGLSVEQVASLARQWAREVVTDRAALVLEGRARRPSARARKKGTRQK